MSQEYLFHAPYGEAEKVEPYLSMYTDNDNLFVGLAYEDPDLGKMPYTDVTVNVTKLPYLMAAVDVNNNGYEMMVFLADNGLAVPLRGQSVRSGFVDYPIVVFVAEALEKIDPKVFAEYQQAYGMEPNRDEQSADNPYRIFENDGGKAKEVDPAITDAHQKENGIEANCEEAPLEELIGMAKEQASEKNQVLGARDDAPAKNPHGMDR